MRSAKVVLRVMPALVWAAACLSGCAQTQQSVTLPGASGAGAAAAVRAAEVSVARACADGGAGFAHCTVLVRTDAASHAGRPNGMPSGYGPQDLWSAYELTKAVAGGSGATLALIDAYDNPNLASDLATYRSTYGLPACSGSCLVKVNQTGGSSLPSGNQGWGLEEALDVDMASALCPNCNLLVVEATSASNSDLGAAVKEATALDATVIATGYSGSEYAGEDKNTPYDAGRPVTAAGDDSGEGTSYPAASAYVTAVGETELTKGGGGSRGWTETAVAGGGCSAYVKKPAFQAGITLCTTRIDNDVAFVGDPSTGVAVYDTYGYGGWTVVGGTSVGAPAIAAVYALAGNAAHIKNASYVYKHAAKLFDIPPPGYDEATGNGTPDGVKGF